MHEGKQHGLQDCMDWIEDIGAGLVIIPDAGSNDTEECKKLQENNIKVIVLDHHICDEYNPYALVINNQLCDYVNKDFSGAGIVWQFCRYLDKLLQADNANNYLDLTALGNCADMMSMVSIETKHIINKGFHNVKNPFFVYLAQKNEYSMKGKINHMSVAFYIAPYLNAICRSGTEDEKLLVFKSMLKHEAFKILPSTKRGHAFGETEQLVEQAMRVVTNVKNRQTKAQDSGLETLEAMIENQHLLDHKVLLFLLEPGLVEKNIAGLIANKIMAKYQRPVCVLTKVIEDNTNEFITDNFNNFNDIPSPAAISYQGSARGCDIIGVTEFKTLCADTGVCEYCTGHEGAFGLGIKQENI
jgi:single-stranded-DNA-specific exonuclease